MPRGRPIKSQIRQNIIELLAAIGKDYGYGIHKKYIQIFPACTREVIYYNLKKGVKLGELAIESVQEEHGDYSWGKTVQKTYYKLGPNAKPVGDPRVKAFTEKQKK